MNPEPKKITITDEKDAAVTTLPEPTNTTPLPETASAQIAPKPNPFKRFGRWYWRKKWLTLPLTLLLLLIIALLIPLTRYGLISWFWKQDVSFRLTDSQTKAAVSEATVSIGGQTGTSDKNGLAKITKLPVGPQKVEVSKKYYKTYTADITVSEFGNNAQGVDVSLEATGRIVPLTVQDKISGNVLENATVAIGDDNKATTDKEGQATIVVPADKNEVEATISATGFHQQSVKLAVSGGAGQNTFGLVATGKLYFLSKQTGKIDVVKTNLDGSERKVVYAGTGKEDEYSASLLASRDWKYLAFKSKREADKASVLYLINTADDTVVTIDDSKASLTPVGWSDHRFIYKVDREYKPWEPKDIALKSFNAETRQAITLDETSAEGTNDVEARFETIENPYILASGIVYIKNWSKHYNSGASFAGKQVSIVSIKADGTSKKTLKGFAAEDVSNINATLYKPQEVYFALQYRNAKPSTYLELEDGIIEDLPSDSSDLFNKSYPTFLVSPKGDATFWAESRDGKNVLFTGGQNAENEKQIAELHDYAPYGWFTDNYVLASKKGSELYIMSKDGLKTGQEPLKVSDYHRPSSVYPGYGYGYGGI